MYTQALIRIALPILAAMVSGSLGMALYLNRFMQSNHPTEWNALGRPTVLNNSIANNILLLRYFVFGSAYRSLNDTHLNKLVVMLRALYAGSTIVFATIFLSTWFLP